MSEMKPSTAPRTGTTISLDFAEGQRFVIGKVLAGGMGMVLQLVPTDGGCAWAMKTLQPQTDLKTFQNECDIWLSLCGHKRVAQAIAYGCWNGSPCILADWYPHDLSRVS